MIYYLYTFLYDTLRGMLFDTLKKKFFSPHAYIGCDIGTTSIKLVELAKEGQYTHLRNYALLESYGHFERSNNVIQANDLKISQNETVELLKTVLSKTHFSSVGVVASVPSFASFITAIEVPQMSDEETNKTMTFQIKEHIPLPLSEIAVDWIRVGQHEDENGFTKQQILLVAVPRDTIERYRMIFKAAGLSLHALEVEPLAYARAVIGNDQTPTLILDIGARSTNITVSDQGFVKHNAQIDYAGDTLTSAIAKGLGVNARRAEELKKQKGIVGGRGEYELSTLEIPFVDVILHEADKARAHVEGMLGIKIQRILIIGGGALLIGLEAYVEQKLGIPTMRGNGLLYVQTPPQLAAVSKELEARFATAIGLAIKGFV